MPVVGSVCGFGIAGREAIMTQQSVERLSQIQVAGRSAHRSKAPVFVLGCPRSGTTVLYHMLLSAGGFANYRSESNVFNILVPRFGGMRSAADRKRLMEAWVRSMLFRVSGLDAAEITARVIADCRNGGDFLRIVMGEIVKKQGVERWADCTPHHLLSMKEIKRQIPDALFIHIIRDGRDVALSYLKQGWAHPLLWDRGEELGVAALYWKWIVGKGRVLGKELGSDYQEVRFEDLIANPQQVLDRLGDFMNHDLDYRRIQQAGIGSVSEPNTSFETGPDGDFDPVGRWKTRMSAEEFAHFEALAGDLLEELGYSLGSLERIRPTFRDARLRATYLNLSEMKQWLKTCTPLGRLVRLKRIEIESIATLSRVTPG
jgi:Sulfotransferase family